MAEPELGSAGPRGAAEEQSKAARKAAKKRGPGAAPAGVREARDKLVAVISSFAVDAETPSSDSLVNALRRDRRGALLVPYSESGTLRQEFLSCWEALSEDGRAQLRDVVAEPGWGEDTPVHAARHRRAWPPPPPPESVGSALWPAEVAALFGRLDGSPEQVARLANSQVDCGGGEPPITRAVTEGRTSLVRDYLVAGADPDRPDSRGTTALMYACFDRSDVELASLLCVAGGGGSAVQTNRRGLTAEELVHRYTQVNKPQLLRILGVAGRLSHEQLLVFGAGYHLRLGDESPICEYLNVDLMDRIA